jgi:hypothetical protein
MRIGSRIGKRLGVALAAASAALGLVGVAGADQYQVRLTAAGNAAARAAVVTRSDLGSTAGWTGVSKKPDLSSSPTCAGFDPKESDLVIVGAAETDWKHPGLEFDSVAEVLQTAKMVQLDWQRVMLSPKLLPCLRKTVPQSLGAGGKLVAARELPVPRLATYTKAFEVLIDVKSGSRTVRLMIDMLFVGRGRTEITLMTTAAFAARPIVQPAEIRLARALVSRARV